MPLTSLKETTIRQGATRWREPFEDIVQHFTTKVDRNGVKGQIVTFDRESCLLYKTQLDKLLLPEASTAVGSDFTWRNLLAIRVVDGFLNYGNTRV